MIDGGESKGWIGRFFGVAIPTSLQFLMLSLVGAADAFMLGRVGQDEMASVSLATQFQFLQNMIIAAVASGITILGAQYRGKGDNETVSKVYRIGVRTAMAISALFALGCILIPDFLMCIFTNQETLSLLGIKYLRIAGFSYFLTGISICYHSVLKVADKARYSAGVSALTVSLNIVLNALLIFGFGSFLPAMGVEGAAWATLIARIAEFLVLFFTASRASGVRLGFSALFTRYSILSGDFLRCALPVAGAYLVWSVGFASYTGNMGHLGSNAAAANAVAAVVRDILSCLADGGAVAAGIIVGKELGAGRLDLAKYYGGHLVRLSVALALGCTVVVLLSIPLLTKVAIMTEDAKAYLTGMLIVLSLYQIGRYVNTIVITGVFTSGGDTMFDFYSLVATMWGLAVPMALVGAFVFTGRLSPFLRAPASMRSAKYPGPGTTTANTSGSKI